MMNSFRDAISTNATDRIILGYELRSQPDDTLEERIPGIQKRNEAIIIVAREEDVVLLTEPVSAAYHGWLRSLGLSTDNIYPLQSGDHIPDAIKKNSNLLRWLDQFPGERIYVPRYSGEGEVKAADLLQARLFGCDEETVLKFYDKTLFKDLCRKHDIPVLPSETISLNGPASYEELKRVARRMLDDTDRVFMKDPTASAGANIYIASNGNVDNAIERIQQARIGKILIEKSINPTVEINDQWVITFDGRILPLASSDQIVENCAHSGNSWPSASPNLLKANNYSQNIAEMMREAGYIGPLGIDYLEDEKGIYVSEDNARMNGSTPAWDLINRLEKRHGSIRGATLYQVRDGRAMSFDELKVKTKETIYDGKRKYCSFPLDQGLLQRTGAVTLLTTGESPEHAQYILERTLERIK